MSASLSFMAAAWDELPGSGDRSNADRKQPVAVPEKHPDRAIIEAIRAGDRVVFTALYVRLYDALWGFAVRVLHSADAAEDVVQDVFLSLWRQRFHWIPITSIDAYLFAAVRNRAVMQLRHQSVIVRNAARIDWEQSFAYDPEVTHEQDDRQRRLFSAIAALPERQATALTLRWIHDLTYPEVAQVLGISSQAARTLVLRVEAVLKQKLQNFRD